MESCNLYARQEVCLKGSQANTFYCTHLHGDCSKLHFGHTLFVTQYNKMYTLSTFEKVEMFAVSNRGFNKLSNDTQFLKNEAILLEIQQFTKSIFPFIYFIFCTLFCSLSQNKHGRQDVPFVVLGHLRLPISHEDGT